MEHYFILFPVMRKCSLFMNTYLCTVGENADLYTLNGKQYGGFSFVSLPLLGLCPTAVKSCKSCACVPCSSQLNS